MTSVFHRSRSAWRYVVGAGCAAAAADLLYACGFYYVSRGVVPQRVLQTIASGWFGQDSYSGGWGTAAFGFMAHFLILIVAAWWYWLASHRWKALRERWVPFGLLYGATIYCAMNFVVIPLSNAPFAGKAFDVTLTAARAGDFCSHLLVGLIIAFGVRGYWRRGAQA